MILLLVTSTSRIGFRLTEIPGEQIPERIREMYAGEDVLTWLACYEQDGYTVVWYKTRSPFGGTPVYCYSAITPQGSGHGGGGFDHVRYSWGWGTGGHGLSAAGTAFSNNAKKVVGFLTDGSTCQGAVVNGFWYLCVAEPMGDWQKIEVLNDRGRTIHTFKKPL